MSEWVYDKVFDQPRAGLKRQEFVSYEIRDHKMIKVTVTRRFYGVDDYQDSTHTEVICDATD